MEEVQFILTILLWVMCPLLVLLVLVQGGTGDVASSFGGGGQLDSSLGVGASKKMAKLTGVLSVVFLIAVLIISIPVEKTVNSYGLDPLAPVAPAAVEPAVQPTPGALQLVLLKAAKLRRSPLKLKQHQPLMPKSPPTRKQPSPPTQKQPSPPTQKQPSPPTQKQPSPPTQKQLKPRLR